MNLAVDTVYTSDDATDASRQILSFTETQSGDASKGLIATINAVVETSATYTSTLTAENSVGSVWLSMPAVALLLFILGLFV